MKAKTIDEKFDDGEEVLDAFDLSKATRPNQKKCCYALLSSSVVYSVKRKNKSNNGS